MCGRGRIQDAVKQVHAIPGISLNIRFCTLHILRNIKRNFECCGWLREFHVENLISRVRDQRCSYGGKTKVWRWCCRIQSMYWSHLVDCSCEYASGTYWRKYKCQKFLDVDHRFVHKHASTWQSCITNNTRFYFRVTDHQLCRNREQYHACPWFSWCCASRGNKFLNMRLWRWLIP